MQQLPDNDFQILRVAIEGQIQLPAVITVSSALREDGATYVASGLARAFAEAGHPTVLLAANDERDGRSQDEILDLRQRNGSDGLGTRTAEFDNLYVAALGNGSRKQAGNLSALLSSLRSEYSVVIVDAAPVPASATALELSRKADGVLLTVKVGRRTHSADRVSRQLLESSGATIIGMVLAKPQSARPLPNITSVGASDVSVRPFRGAVGAEVIG